MIAVSTITLPDISALVTIFGGVILAVSAYLGSRTVIRSQVVKTNHEILKQTVQNMADLQRSQDELIDYYKKDREEWEAERKADREAWDADRVVLSGELEQFRQSNKELQEEIGKLREQIATLSTPVAGQTNP